MARRDTERLHRELRYRTCRTLKRLALLWKALEVRHDALRI